MFALICITLSLYHHRKALSLEPDKNKQCNLAICLVHMNRISEAKLLLQDVKASTGNEQMDESYSKSFDRAIEMLSKVERQPILEPVTQEPDKGRDIRRSLASFGDRSLKEASMFLPENEDNNFNGFDERSSKCKRIGFKGILHSSPQTTYPGKWSQGSCLESPPEGSFYSSKLNENWGCTGQEVGSAQKKSSLGASRMNTQALFTQPRSCSWGFNNANLRKGRCGEDTVRSSVRKLSFEQVVISESVPSHSIQNHKEESQTPSNGKSLNPATGQVEREVEESLSGVLLTQPKNSSWPNNRDQRRGRWAEESVGSSFRKLSFEEETTTGLNSHSAKNPTGEPLVSPKDELEMGLEKPINTPNKKSWADMVEEEEEKEELRSGRKHPGKSYGSNKEEEFNDENLNSNIMYPDPKDHIENITQQLQSFDMKNGNNALVNTVSSRRNRLQVFRDITSP